MNQIQMPTGISVNVSTKALTLHHLYQIFWDVFLVGEE